VRADDLTDYHQLRRRLEVKISRAPRFLCGRYSRIEVGLRIDTARVAAERLIKTDWARARVPVIAQALNERGVLSGDDVYALF